MDPMETQAFMSKGLPVRGAQDLGIQMDPMGTQAFMSKGFPVHSGHVGIQMDPV